MFVETDGRQVHRPTLIVALRCCDRCKDDMPTSWRSAKKLVPCERCGPRFHSWDIQEDRDRDIATEFTKWLFSDENRFATAVSHNMKGLSIQYDSYFNSAMMASSFYRHCILESSASRQKIYFLTGEKLWSSRLTKFD